MDERFTYSSPPYRVVSGSGAIEAWASKIGAFGIGKP
jgi:hypothetical protein